MESLLRQNPTAQVLTVDDSGNAVPLPASLTLDRHQRLDDCGSAHEVVVPHDLPTVSEAWTRAQDFGFGRASVRLASPRGLRASIYFVDARHRHGVYVCVVARNEDHLLPDLQQALLSPRACVAQKDEVGRFIGVEATLTQMLGWSAADLLGRQTIDLVHPDDAGPVMANWVDMLAVPGARRRVRARHKNQSGSWRWVEMTNHNLLEDPERRCIVTEMVDVSDEVATGKALRASEQSLLRLAEALPLGVLQIDRERRIVYRNERLGQIIGRRSGATIDEQFSTLDDAGRAQLASALDAVFGQAQDDNLEVAVKHRRGTRHCSLSLRALTEPSGTVTGAILCVADVTEDVRLRQELHNRAVYDRLTHCYNRASILSSLENILLEACLKETGTCVIFVDLDHFKPINDELGHAAGDAMLVHVADRLLSSLRSEDRVGRMGGDEFLVVCPDVKNPDQALKIAERLAASLSAPIELAGRRITPSASMGVSWSPTGGDTADALVARADAAMYQSKSERRGHPVLSTPAPARSSTAPAA